MSRFITRRWWVLYWPAVAIIAALATGVGLLGAVIGWVATPLGLIVGGAAGIPLGHWMFERCDRWEIEHGNPRWWAE